MFRTCLTVSILLLMHITLMSKPRLIVTTDIGGDPDDQQSLVRLLVYSNEFDIEALIASASGTPGELSMAKTSPDLIREEIEAYGQVRGNLLLHDPDYPTKQYLLDRVKSGNKYRGTDYIGSGHDTDGSDYIISVVDKNDARLVNVSIWGGQTDLAQALWKVKNTRSSSEYQSFVSKIRVHDIADQDGIFSYIRGNFPELWYVLDKTRTSDKCSSVFRGMFYQGNTGTVTLSWLRANIKNGHGALGALYPDEGLWTCGNNINAVKEGDTPSWFFFLENGMHMPSEPTFGGWGGRFEQEAANYWRDAYDTVDGNTLGTATVYRWRNEYQNDFAARMDWCVNGYAGANHAPVAIVNYNTQTVKSGDVVLLDATGSSDPDGDNLSYEWMYYPEAGTWGGSLTLTNGTSRIASFTAPDVSLEKTIHIILKVSDDGSPALTSYQRVIVITQPSAGQGLDVPFCMNAGGGVSGTWQTDGAFVEDGDTYTTDKTIVTSGVADAGPAEMYQSCRHNGPSFFFNVPDGAYTVRLHFCEPHFTSMADADDRNMTVQLNGRTVLDDFNPAVAAGACQKAYAYDENITISGGSGLDVDLIDNGGDAFIMGIEILENTTAAVPYFGVPVTFLNTSAPDADAGFYDLQGRVVSRTQAGPGVYLQSRMTTVGLVYKKITIVK